MIYLDNASTTKINEEVFNVMLPYLKDHFENPSSLYENGVKNKKAINMARGSIASLLNCAKNEIYFCSGGSEANNWALKGVVCKTNKKEIITTKIEHHATLHACAFLEKQGYTIKYVNVDHEGFVNLEHLKNLMNQNTALVSIMFANNEIGTIQDIKAISKICKERDVLFHTDAVQVVCHVPIDVNALGIDLMSISAHKFGGPKGIGCLYVRNGVEIENLIHGGKQEYGKRGGTENTPYIVGMAKAMELSMQNLVQDEIKKRTLAITLYNEIKSRIKDVKLNGPELGKNRLPGNLNLSFKGVDGSLLSYLLGNKGICVSTGSACNSDSIEPSHVLQAINVDQAFIQGTIRITLGSDSTKEDIKSICDAITEIINNKLA